MKRSGLLISLAALLVLGVVIGFSMRAQRQAPAAVQAARPSPAGTPAVAATTPAPSVLIPESTPAVPPPAAPTTKSVALMNPPAADPGTPHVPTKAEERVAGAPPPLPIPPDFLENMIDASGKVATFALPGGLTAVGSVELVQRDTDGRVSLVQGSLSAPHPGFFYFNKEAVPGVAGAFSGNARFEKQVLAYRAEPIGTGGAPMLVPRRLDQIMCLGLPPVGSSKDVSPIANAPQTYPTNAPAPAYNNNVVSLQSLPGAKGVVYLDFNGGPGPWIGWGNFVALPSGATNTQIREVWQRVAEDYQGFNLNITTDVKVFNAATPSNRQHVMLTPTTTAAPGAGGVAFENSFNTSADEVNWAFYATGKNGAEVCSHEVGHTLGLSHMGQNITDSTGTTTHYEYYGGRGTGDVSWAPIMGAGYYDNLSQFSHGDYQNPSNTEDQLAIIATNNNNVAYRTDDDGATFATANYLEILDDNTVSNEGIIERTGDVDAYRFTVTASGAVTFTVNPVNAGPNLDIVASIYKSDDTTLVATTNPATAINATVSATLPAGDYTLQVSPTGYGDPQTTGYSNYGVLGAYLITGTAANGVKPARFGLAENSANATAVGTVTPRNNHGSSTLTYAISSGNTGAPFSINAATGAITVANGSLLNFEKYSTRWDVPAAIPLFVTITDSANPALNETIRVLVTLTNVNEAPSITGGSATMFAHTQVGTAILTVTGSDPDQLDFPTFSIAAGNTGNAFAIDAGTGVISPATDINVSASTVYTLTVRATDQGTPALTADATVTITVLPLAAGYVPGTIPRAYYENISGTALSALTASANFPSNPDSEQILLSSDGLQHGDNFGSVMRGFVIPPTTGSYTFYIASDDTGELRISTDATQANAVVRASNSSATNQNVYNNYASQTSVALTLTAGQPYYIEARHKEGSGDDHVSIAWKGPNIAQQVIPGRFLAPFFQNYVPRIAATTFYARRDAYNGSVVGTVPVTDVNAQDTHGSFTITGGSGANLFGIDPGTGVVRVTNVAGLAAGGSYTLTVSTTDSGTPALSGSGTITIKALEPGAINIASGSISQQIWTNMTGASVASLTSDVRYPLFPTTTRLLTSFTGPSGLGNYYGTRVRALVTPPTTGSYTFYISSDDSSRLVFNTTSSASGAAQIASVNGSTSTGVYTQQATQTSAAFALTAGQSYYIEALQKQGAGGDFLQVAWTGPGITTPTIIPGSALTPYNINTAPAFGASSYTFPLRANAAAGTVVGTISATDPEGESVAYAILANNTGGAFAINPATGVITVANSAAVTPGQTTVLSVGAQDGGIGAVYPLAVTTVPVSITIPKPVDQWRQDMFGANAGNAAIAGNLADPDGDGLSNLAEYAFGTDPLKGNTSPVLIDREKIGPNYYLLLSVRKNPAATDVTFTAEATGDLVTPGSWSSSTVVVETNSSTTLTVRDTVPIGGAGGRFLRLRVSVP